MAKRLGSALLVCGAAVHSDFEGQRAPRIHLRRRGADRTLCGIEVKGVQPEKRTEVSCFACMRRVRDTERPPPPTKDVAPVVVGGAGVHLALRSPPPFFVHDTALCGRKVKSLLATGQTGATCRRCAELAKVPA